MPDDPIVPFRAVVDSFGAVLYPLPPASAAAALDRADRGGLQADIRRR